MISTTRLVEWLDRQVGWLDTYTFTEYGLTATCYLSGLAAAADGQPVTTWRWSARMLSHWQQAANW